MTDKQEHFVQEFCNNGFNATEAYKTAYPACKVGHQQSSSKLLLNPVIREAIEATKKWIESWKEGGRELCDRLFSERYEACVGKKDNTNAIRCLENKAKNVGYYATDNAQRTEQAKLTEEQEKEAKAYAKWRLLRGLNGPQQVQETA